MQHTRYSMSILINPRWPRGTSSQQPLQIQNGSILFLSASTKTYGHWRKTMFKSPIDKNVSSFNITQQLTCKMNCGKSYTLSDCCGEEASRLCCRFMSVPEENATASSRKTQERWQDSHKNSEGQKIHNHFQDSRDTRRMWQGIQIYDFYAWFDAQNDMNARYPILLPVTKC